MFEGITPMYRTWAGTASILAYASSAGAISIAWNVNELAIAIGALSAAFTAAANFYFRWKADKREAAHDAREAEHHEYHIEQEHRGEE